MKFLFLGEYSGILTPLKVELIAQGHKVTHIHGGDHGKKITGASFFIGSNISQRYIRLIVMSFKYIFAFKYYFSNDVVVIVNQSYFRFGYLDWITIKILKLFNRKIILMACGDDVPLISYGKRGKMLWWVHQRYANCNGLSPKYFQRKVDNFLHRKLSAVASKIIPSTYTYSLCWHDTEFSSKVTKVWNPICSNLLCLGEQKKNIGDKIIITHGRNRPCEKGSKYIEKALEKIVLKYKDKVDVRVFDLLPLNEYTDLVLTSDIIIDQCLGYDYGSINAISSIGLGKTVLVSSSDASLKFNDIDDGDYFYRIKPDIDDIFQVLEKIILDWPSNRVSSFKCREFIESRHNPLIQTMKFLEYINE